MAHTVPTLIVSPSEAFLLGACLGEYEGHCQADTTSWFRKQRFFDILEARLSLFIPTFLKLSIRDIDESQLPSDIKWDSVVQRYGLSPSQPRPLYEVAQGKFRVKTWIDARKSLFDQLVILLGPAINVPPFQRLLGSPSDAAQYGACFVAAFEELSQREDTYSHQNPEDDVAIIRDLLCRLATENKHDECFKAGKAFGELIFRLDEFESYVWHVEQAEEDYRSDELAMRQHELIAPREEALERFQAEYSAWLGERLERVAHELRSAGKEAAGEITAAFEVEFETERRRLYDHHLGEWDELEETLHMLEPDEPFDPNRRAGIDAAVKRLLEHAPVQLGYHATTLLRRLVEEVPTYSVNGDGSEGRLQALRDSVIQLKQAQMACWIAFGEVLGIFHDQDTEVRLKDAESVSARSFKLQPADTPDRVLKRLMKVEADFNNSPSAEFTAQEVVSHLHPAVEGLAKRIWQGDFMPPNFKTNGGFWGLLQNKLRNGIQLEQRFASVAMPLFKQYRNSAVHDIDEFECSFEEARYFIAGVRALVDLWRQLEERQT